MIEVQRPQKQTNNGTSKGVQFLSPKHVHAADGKLLLKVTDCTTNEPDNYGNPVVVYFVDASGVQYSKGFKLTSDNLADICDILGKDETKFAGKYLLVTVETTKRGQEQLKFKAAPKR